MSQSSLLIEEPGNSIKKYIECIKLYYFVLICQEIASLYELLLKEKKLEDNGYLCRFRTQPHPRACFELSQGLKKKYQQAARAPQSLVRYPWTETLSVQLGIGIALRGGCGLRDPLLDSKLQQLAFIRLSARQFRGKSGVIAMKWK